ncbi:MAG: hypothetical protein EKE20_16300 [Candidatus Symbiopectobacterium sp. Dall1.0]|nr:hypothetical protein [Candidatus Symbiopectobacterium sp. Dall1.0]
MKGTYIDLLSVNKVLFPFVDLGIGDAVCHTGMWERLKNKGYTIQVIAEERTRVFFEKITDIDELYIIDTNNLESMASIDTDLVISLYSWIRKKEFLNAQLLLKLNYKYAISFGGRLKKHFNIYIPVKTPFHITHPQQHILEILGIYSDALEYSISIPNENELFIRYYLNLYKKTELSLSTPLQARMTEVYLFYNYAS